MKLKLDENLPESLVTVLSKLGHDTDNVRLEGLGGTRDEEVWSATQAAGRFLLTQDLDFSDIRKFQPGTHYGLMLIRFPEAGRLALSERIAGIFESEDAESWAGCFVLVTAHKLRVVRPGES